MKQVTLNIPDDLASKMTNFTANAEAFIIDLLRSKVKELDNSVSLADEYRLASIENKKLMQDFSSVDLEKWEGEY